MMPCQKIVDRTFRSREAPYRNPNPNDSRLRKNYPIEQTKMLARNIRSGFTSQETTRTFYLLLQNYQLCSVSFFLLTGAREQQRASKPRRNHPTKGSMKHTRSLLFCQRQMPLARTTRKKKDRERDGERKILHCTCQVIRLRLPLNRTLLSDLLYICQAV